MVCQLSFSPPNDTSHQLKEGKGFAKKVQKQVTKKNLPAILCQDACQRLMLHPYITVPQEQAAKTSMVLEVRIQVFSIMYS